MSATQGNIATVTPKVPALNFSITGGALSEVETVLEDALNVLDVIPVTAPFAGLATLLLGIITAAVTRIKSETGKPIDLNIIPTETPLP
jgi:hypothetical protein